MNASKVVLFAVYIVMVLLSVALAGELYALDKRAQDRPFMMSSRYGRSNSGINRGSSGKHVVVAPRTDKFFLASRYGKRSELLPNLPMAYPTDILPLCANDDLACSYTGFSNLYRCVQRKGTPDDEESTEN